MDKKAVLSINIKERDIDRIKQFLENMKILSCVNTEDPMKILERIKKNDISIILFYKKDIRLFYDLSWESPNIKTGICMDIEFSDELPERKNKLMNKKLWDFVAMKSVNNIMDGGWENSYTRKPFTNEEILEFQKNTLFKLKPFLNNRPRVLEIGCSSGVTLDTIAKYASVYKASDISVKSLEKLRLRIEKLKQNGQYLNTEFYFECVSANEITDIETQYYDIIMLNSVVHCFDDHKYFLDVIYKAANLVRDGGIIFVGDILALDTKEEFLRTLIGYKNNHPYTNTKVDFSQELFLSQQFIRNIPLVIGHIDSVEITPKYGRITNELKKYRFDAILKVNQKKENIFAIKEISVISAKELNGMKNELG